MSTTKSNSTATTVPTSSDKASSVWKGKSADTSSAPSSSKAAAKEKPSTEELKAKKVYQPKLMLETDEDAKSVVIKIAQRSGVRQIVNYALPKIRDGWLVTFSGFQMEISKVLLAVEIIKCRIAFLHQETTFVDAQMPRASKDSSDDAADKSDPVDAKTTYTRNGLQVKLSREAFTITNQLGYQKPKPRSFLQTQPPRVFKPEPTPAPEEKGKSVSAWKARKPAADESKPEKTSKEAPKGKSSHEKA